MITDTSVEIAIDPQFRGQCGATDLFRPDASMVFAVGFDGPPQGIAFAIKGMGYELACFFADNSLILSRNGRDVRVDLGAFPRGKPLIATVMWEPHRLLVGVHYEGYGQERDCITAPTFPPHALWEWARRNALASVVTYPDALSVHGEVVAQLVLLANRIIDTNAINPFWDITYDGRRIVERKPKRETDIHPLIRLLLYAGDSEESSSCPRISYRFREFGLLDIRAHSIEPICQCLCGI
jgi:hypothetical protein